MKQLRNSESQDFSPAAKSVGNRKFSQEETCPIAKGDLKWADSVTVKPEAEPLHNLLNDYLNKVDRYLRPLPAAERADIINEIKSQMMELMASDCLSPEQITARLGSPKELAGAYLGESFSKNSSFSLRRLLCAILFYSLVGLGGIFILPFTTILAGTLLFCSIIAPVSGVIKAAGFLLGFDVPWVSFQFGSWTAHPLLALPLSVLLGILMFLAGKGFWKLTLKYIRAVSPSQ